MWLKSRQDQDLRRSGEDGARSSSEDREGTDVQDQVPKIGIEHARCRRWLVCLMWLNLALFSMSSTLFVLSLASARPLYVDRVPERQRNHEVRHFSMPCEILLVTNPWLAPVFLTRFHQHRFSTSSTCVWRRSAWMARF